MTVWSLEGICSVSFFLNSNKLYEQHLARRMCLFGQNTNMNLEKNVNFCHIKYSFSFVSLNIWKIRSLAMKLWLSFSSLLWWCNHGGCSLPFELTFAIDKCWFFSKGPRSMATSLSHSNVILVWLINDCSNASRMSGWFRSGYVVRTTTEVKANALGYMMA